MKKRRIFALLLTLALLMTAVLPMGACAEEEKVTLRVMSMSTNPNGAGPMDNEVTKLIEDELGIIIDMTVTNEQDMQQQLPAMIASNDLPDVFFIPETDTMKYIDMMYKGGLILALDDYLEEYAPNLMSDPAAQASLELKRQTLSPDGKVYVIGMNRGTFDSGIQPIVGQFIRWDLYAKLGYPEMETYDDLLYVLKDMQDLENETSDGEKVYAVGAWFGDSQGWGDWHLTYNMAYAEGYNCLTPGDRTVYSDIATNKIVEMNMQKEKDGIFWRQVRWYNKAYQMGILDPDSFTQKSDQYEDKVTNGRYLFVNPGWMIEPANRNFAAKGEPEKALVCLPPIGTDKFTLYRYYISGQFNYGVSASCKHPEKAVQLLDWVSSYENAYILYNGVEGKYWNRVDGVPTPTAEYLDIDRDSPEIQSTEGLNIFGKLIGYGYATVDPATGAAVDLYSCSPEALARRLTPAHQDMLDHYGYETLPELYEAMSPGGNIDMTLFNLGNLPEELQMAEANLQAYEFKNIFKCILAESDEEFERLQDEYIAGLDAYNIDEIYDYWVSVGKAQEEELQPVLDLLG